MIQGFEKETAKLNQMELSSLGILNAILKTHKTDNPIKSKDLIRQLKINGVDVKHGARIRKMVNVLRRTSLPNLAASSKGYYVETDLRKLKQYSQSLRDRASAIISVAESIESHFKAELQERALKSQTSLFTKID